MSYDIRIIVNHSDGYSSSFEVGNMTYNVAPMVVEASGVSFSWYDGISCAKALPLLRRTWQQMKRDPETYKRLEAWNGWGTYDQFMPYLTRLYAMVRLHPTGVIEVS